MIASAIKHMSNPDEVVGDHGLDSSFICISPLYLTLAFSLSSQPWLFNFAFEASLTGITSSAGNVLSVTSKVTLSKRPFIPFLIASPHFSCIVYSFLVFGVVILVQEWSLID